MAYLHFGGIFFSSRGGYKDAQYTYTHTHEMIFFFGTELISEKEFSRGPALAESRLGKKGEKQ